MSFRPLSWFASKRRLEHSPAKPDAGNPTARSHQPRRGISAGRRKRSFASGDSDNIFENFSGVDEPIDGILLRQLPRMRARSRKIAGDSDYSKRYLSLLSTNVIGPEGIALVPKARNRPGGDLDVADNATLLRGWREWNKAENCSVQRTLTWRQIEKQCVQTAARDGEFLLRLVSGFDNDFGFAVQLLDPALLDVNLNQPLKDNRQISLGVEKDSWGAPLAYYFSDRNGSTIVGAGKRYTRIPAAEIVHGFVPEWINQSRGIPWMNTSIRALKMLDSWLEAELVGANVASAKMGFYTSPDGEGMTGDDEDDDGTLVQNVEAGTFEQLPAGVKVEKFDPEYPNSSAGEFVKVMLRGASAGMNVAYNTLANDLESVNYSSLRAGTLDERDGWRDLQSWISSVLHARVYKQFLKMALLKGAFDTPLPPSKIQKFAAAEWQPRGWAWVDPNKDIQAAERAIALGVTTRARIVASQGNPDWEGTIEQLGKENLLADSFGVNVGGVGAQKEKSNGNTDEGSKE